MDAPGETWRGINLALLQGLRGLPGGSSLHGLLRARRNIPGKRSPYEHPGRGRPRNLAQRRRAARLRARGFTLAQIGERLGITHQAVSQLLQDAPPQR
jgi:hypothetical protein